jgi:adenosylcobinamide-phosphate guanylyltransferase
MKVTAVVMAGGKGTRMTLAEEKPLLRVGGKPVIELVLQALKNSQKVDAVVVAVSEYTPKTTKHLESLTVKTLKTPGKEYVSDLAYAVKTLKIQTVLAIPADMPLITGEIIDEVIDHYAKCAKPALAVAVPLETKRKLGMSLSYAFDHGNKCVVPAGINMIEGARIDDGELEQEVYILDKAEVAININTADELKTAEEQFALKKIKAPGH